MLPRYRVMLVDDSGATRASLRQFLAQIGAAHFDIVEAENGVHALKKLTTDNPVDLVITDLSMPEMDGVDLIRHLRQRPGFREVPILFLTSHDDEERKALVFRNGATDYVVKPFLAPELESRILGYLERKRAFETLRQGLEEAHATQAAMMPQQVPDVPGIRLAAKWMPADRLGGDFYDFYALGGDALGLLIADVSGHGIAAALVSFLAAGVLKDLAPRCPEPHALLRRAGEVLAGKMPQERYATVFYATYAPKDRAFTYSAAGHPGAVLVRGDEVRTLGMEGTPIGLEGAASAVYTSDRVVLQPGDRVLLHSDGLVGGAASPLGFRALKEYLQGARDLGPVQLLDGLYGLGLSVGGAARYSDDVTMVVLDVTGG